MYTYFMQIGMIPIKRDGYGMMNDPVIQLKNVHFRYNEELVLDGINLSVPEGAFVGIVGPNGSGKSTLLKLVLGLLKPVEGEILLFGQKQALFKRQERIGFVSQKANSFNSGFPATVFEVVASGLTRKVGMFRFLKRKDKLDVLQAIRQVGLEPYVNRKIGELSGASSSVCLSQERLLPNLTFLFWMNRPLASMRKTFVYFTRCLHHYVKKWGSLC